MKRYITNILIFFAIVAVIDLGLGYAGDYLQAHAKGGDTKKLNDLVMNDTHDIIIFGSSRAHHHYDTPFLSDSLGLDVYNAGYDGNGVVLAYGLLDLILQRYQPKLILFDVEPSFDVSIYKGDNNHKRYISALKPYYDIAGVGEVIKDVSCEEWYKVHSGMLRYNSNMVSLIADYNRTFKSSNHGYVPSIGEYSGLPMKGDGTIDPIDAFKVKYIEKIISLAQSYGIPVVIVASPKYAENLYENLRPVIDICEKRNIPFWDYYNDERFMLHKEWFKEPMHLNATGAREFSKIIANDIDNILY